MADDDRSSTFAGFRLARGGLGDVSVAYGLFSSVGKFADPPRLEVLGRILPPASGRSFIGRLSVVPAAWLTAVSLACGLALAVFRAVAGCHTGIDGPFFLAFGRRERLLLIYPGLFQT